MFRTLFTAITISILINSCTEYIEIDLENGDNNKLVVEGSITTELKVHQVKLTRTTDYFDNRPFVHELGALVSITDGDTTLNLFDTGNEGVYRTDKEYAGKANHNYTLNIELNNGERYSATETIKPILPMDSITCEYKKSIFPFDDNYYYFINLFAQEDPEPGNNYQFEVFLDGQHVTDTVKLKVFVNDDFTNGNYLSNWTVYQIPDYKINNDTSELTLQILSISEKKYDFYTAILLETEYSGGPFSGPPANVPTNISNGALGFFSASAVAESKIEIVKARPK